jgi:hypothetical protein
MSTETSPGYKHHSLFGHGDYVRRKVDSEVGIITAICIRPHGRTYGVNWPGNYGEQWHHELELMPAEHPPFNL